MSEKRDAVLREIAIRCYGRPMDALREAEQAGYERGVRDAATKQCYCCGSASWHPVDDGWHRHKVDGKLSRCTAWMILPLLEKRHA